MHPRRFHSFLFGALVGAVCFSSLRADDAKVAFFEKKVRPILVGKCLECHGKERRGGLDLRSAAGLARGGEQGAVVKAGKPKESRLYEYVASGEMPPEHPLTKREQDTLRQWIANGAHFSGRTLHPFEISTTNRAGFDWWSLRPIRQPPLPTVRAGRRVRTQLDRFIQARLEQQGLTLSAPVDRETYIRRVTFDLTGLRPTYEEVQGFVNDRQPQAYEKLVDRLLARPEYGERWGRHWLDVVRFAESNGFERDRIRRDFWRYRDYVIRSFQIDKPYNDFVREQIAGDALRPRKVENLIATGFLVAGPKNDVGTISELEQMMTRQDELDEVVSATCTTFLGLTAGCARCHDHKFDPISTEDYYRLTAVFSGFDRGSQSVATPEQKKQYALATKVVDQQLAAVTKELNRLLESSAQRLLARATKPDSGKTLPALSFQRNVDTFPSVRGKFVRFTVTQVTGNGQPCLDELEVYGSGSADNLALASKGAKATASSLLPGYPIHQIHHLNDGVHGNSRSWISNEAGRGWAQVELARTSDIARVVWGRDREGRYKDRLAIGYQLQVSHDGKTWKKVSDSSRRPAFSGRSPSRAERIAALLPAEKQTFDKLSRQQKSLEERKKKVAPLPTSYMVKDSKPRPCFVLRRGNVRSRGAAVQPAALSAVKQLDPSLLSPKGDSGPQRRLRLAEWIVDPANPLTARVWANRIWQYHFGVGLVATASDFGFKGDRPSHPELLDWLAHDLVAGGWRLKRMHRQIVLSATYRQSSASVEKARSVDAGNRWLWRYPPRRIESEALRDMILATSGTLNRAQGGPSFALFRYRDGNVPDYVLDQSPQQDTWRRAVYMYNIRTFQSPLMSAFDCPDVSVQTPRRNRSVTALQALSLLNNPFIFQQARRFAQRVAAEAGPSVRRQVIFAYRRAFSRDPDADECAAGEAFVEGHGLMSLCRVLFNANEFLYVF